MKLEIVTRDFDLTPTIKEKVESKVGKALSKFRLNYVSSHVTLRLHKFPDSGE
jgi:ribosome-associated translation inhibitor RaiA